MNTLNLITARGPLTTHLRSLQDCERQLRPSKTAGMVTSFMTTGVRRMPLQRFVQTTEQTTTARWA